MHTPHFIKSILSFFFSIYAFSLFVIIVLLLFPCLLICMPLGKNTGGNIMYDLFRVMAKVWLGLTGINHTITYETRPDSDSQYIFVCNHISYLDAILVIPTLTHHFRPIGKYELLKIPIFGFLYKYCVITVNRSSADDRARSLNDLRNVLATGISILIFPEGTFNESNKPLATMYDGAFKLAIETGKTIQPFLLLDSFDRLHFSSLFKLTPGKSRAIFIEQIKPSDYPNADAKELKAITEKIMSDKLIAYKAPWINLKNHPQTITSSA